jgi:hypothetical protein
VFEQIEEVLGTLNGRVFEFHAGKEYVQAIRPLLEGVKATVAWPLKGLRIGEQLHWYKERLARGRGGR